MNNEQEKTAISVIDEAANCYYHSYKNIPAHVRKKISLEMLDNIFKKMVVPAIDKVRHIDREHVNTGQEALQEIVEIYAGMEGFVAETAPEGYQQRIIEQMYSVASDALKSN